MTTHCEHMYVDPDWNRVLGLTNEQIADLGLREFAELCLSKGFEPVVRRGGIGPGLTLSVDREALVREAE